MGSRSAYKAKYKEGKGFAEESSIVESRVGRISRSMPSNSERSEKIKKEGKYMAITESLRTLLKAVSSEK